MLLGADGDSPSYVGQVRPWAAEVPCVGGGRHNEELKRGEAQQASFDHLKRSINDNAIAGSDQNLQHHLATDASNCCLSGVLFQNSKSKPGTAMTSSLATRGQEKIIMFLSYRLNDAETIYSNLERECLAVVRCLAETIWLVIGSPYPTMIITYREALKAILEKTLSATRV